MAGARPDAMTAREWRTPRKDLSVASKMMSGIDLDGRGHRTCADEFGQGIGKEKISYRTKFESRQS
jgi:hypothetical protein